MKNLLITLMLGLSFMSFAQTESQFPINEKTNQAEYQEVISTPGTPTELEERAIAWLEEFYKNPTKVLQSNENGSISGKAQFRINIKDKKGNISPNGFVAYKFTIDCKDGKYRYTINEIRWVKPSYFDVSKWEDVEGDHYNEKEYTFYIEQTIAYFEKMMDSLEATMSTPIFEETDEW